MAPILSARMDPFKFKAGDRSEMYDIERSINAYAIYVRL